MLALLCCGAWQHDTQCSYSSQHLLSRLHLPPAQSLSESSANQVSALVLQHTLKIVQYLLSDTCLSRMHLHETHLCRQAQLYRPVCVKTLTDILFSHPNPYDHSVTNSSLLIHSPPTQKCWCVML